MRYTPAQLRDAVGIGQETYRHWKKALPPLRRDARHSPCFTAGDVLAIAIINLLVADFGVRVSALTVVADSLFKECNARSWPALERSLLVFHVPPSRMVIHAERSGLALDEPAMVVPLGRMMESVRRTLLAGDGEPQEMLRFPPVAQPTGSSQRKEGQA